MRYRVTYTENLFNLVADALIAGHASQVTTVHVLAALMDKEGVPIMSFERYRNNRDIRGLFLSRGVTLLDPKEEEK